MRANYPLRRLVALLLVDRASVRGRVVVRGRAVHRDGVDRPPASRTRGRAAFQPRYLRASDGRLLLPPTLHGGASLVMRPPEKTGVSVGYFFGTFETVRRKT